jgi:hypothetical protein
MTDEAERRSQLIRHLEEALTLADEIEDGQTGYLIERALDEARSRQFRLTGRVETGSERQLRAKISRYADRHRLQIGVEASVCVTEVRGRLR